MSRGGKRAGAGRKAVEEPRLRVTVRLPQWLIGWLREQPESQGQVIERALMREIEARHPDDDPPK